MTHLLDAQMDKEPRVAGLHDVDDIWVILFVSYGCVPCWKRNRDRVLRERWNWVAHRMVCSVHGELSVEKENKQASQRILWEIDDQTR